MAINDDNAGQFGIGDYRLHDLQEVYRGFFTLQRARLQLRLFAGGWGGDVTREVLRREPAVAVLLYDPAHHLVGLVEQFRIGALDRPAGPWLLEVVAGIVDSGEQPEQVARRELREEAGIDEVDLYPICDYFVSPGGSNEHMTLFCGVTSLAGKGGIYGLPGDGEDIRFHVLDEAAAFSALADGRCDNAATIICLQWLQLNRQRLHSDGLGSLE